MMDLIGSHDVLHDDCRLKADANNNGEAKLEKYSLRPRSLRSRGERGSDDRRDSNSPRNKKLDKNRPKQKPPPLSKYRRKTANARERNRMREINVAFEALRRAVPHISNSVATGNEKLTKITTLRLAMKYIQALRQALETNEPEPQTYLNNFFSGDADLDSLLSDADSLNIHSDISESFASPDHPLTSPFSEPSDNHSPTFSDHGLPFAESGIESSFEFEDTLPCSDFCEDLIDSDCVGLS